MALMDFNIIIMLMGRQHWETKSLYLFIGIAHRLS